MNVFTKNRLCVRRGSFSVCLLFSLFFSLSVQAGPAIGPPSQPASGPGGRAYHHKKVEKTFVAGPRGDSWIFSPARPYPKNPPVVVFVHGWGASIVSYGAWIDHLVKRGNVVIYPLYQRSILMNPARFTPVALGAIQMAFKRLKSFPYTVQTDKMVILGHSAGGQIAANIAALAKSRHLPHPRALVAIQPGQRSRWFPMVGIPSTDFSQIPKDTLLLVIEGKDDQVVLAEDGKKIFYGATQVSLKNKNFIYLFSDFHGDSPLFADHYAPCGYHESYQWLSLPRVYRPLARFFQRKFKLGRGLKKSRFLSVNPLDYYGCWKLVDGCIDWIYYGKNRNYCLGNTKEQRYMGKWSDGTPIIPMMVTQKP